MESITDNLTQYLLFLGIILIVVEVFLGFTVILLVSLGLAMIATSGLMSTGLINQGLLEAFVAVSVIDGILVAMLWRPMKRLQKDKAPKEVKSDLVGNTFILETDVEASIAVQLRFSGSNWKAFSEKSIAKGKRVRVKKLEVGTLYIEEV